MSPVAMQSAAAGVGIALAGSIPGWVIGRRALRERDTQRLFKALVTGMLARMAVYGAALAYVALRTPLDAVVAACWLLGTYVMLQVIEIRATLRGARRGDS